jgi:hypothetical protein
MSITADPLFVAAEVAWRRESLSAGLPTARRGGQRHTLRHTLRGALTAPRLHHRHAARHA